MAGYTLRRARPADAATIAGVHIRSWQWAYRGQVPDTYLDTLSTMLHERTETWLQLLSTEPLEERTWVAESGDEIVGFARAGLNRDTDMPSGAGEVYALYLEQNAAGKHVGRALLAEAVEFLRERGSSLATLWVLETNARARGFYEAAGWHPDGATKVAERQGFQLRQVRYRLHLRTNREESE